MAGRIAVAAGIAGTAVIVSGIVGVVTVTELTARADIAGSRVSVAKIDVAAPSHPTPVPVSSADSDIPAPAAPETVTVPAPEPRVIASSPVKARSTGPAKSDAASKGGDGRQPAAGQDSAGQGSPAQDSPAQSTDESGRQNAGQTAGDGGGAGANSQIKVNAPEQAPRLLQREGIIAQAPVHGNGHDNNNGRGHDKNPKTQSRESSPAHRD